MTTPPSGMPGLRDFRPFLGYTPEDYPKALAFYQELGFELLWTSDNASEFETGIGHRFLVTLHHGLDRSSAGMLHFWVDSVDAWWDYLAPMNLAETYEGVKVAEPSVTDWGWRILYVWDPGGYLLHFGEPHSEENKAFLKDKP